MTASLDACCVARVVSSQQASTSSMLAMSAIEQPASRLGRITCCAAPLRMSALSAMKCTPQKTMYSASACVGGLLRELERVAAEVGELDDLVALVVVAEDDEPLAQYGSCSGDTAI